MTTKIKQIGTGIKSFLEHLQAQLVEQIRQVIEFQLEIEVDQWLYRESYQRKASVRRTSQAQCQRCGSQQACHFMRNGHRKRQIVVQLGVIEFWLPRVVCQCGGSGQIPFSILQPYQQIWDDVVLQIGRWAELGFSLRQMQREIGEQSGTQVGLRTLNDVVQSVKQPTALELTSVPPVVMLDAIWVTLLQPTGDQQKDKCQRQRIVKERHKVCVLVALGLYPQSGRWGILGWQVADSENQDAWQRLLLPLEQRGVYRQRGLELLIHDGGKGLIAALNTLYPHVPHQRCAFHKLRNLWHTIQTPDDLNKHDKIRTKQEVLQLFQPIWYAQDEQEATRLRDGFAAIIADKQPEFVATLYRDWHETIAFYRVLKRFPDWQRTALRTTSLLERVNRMLRRFFRLKGAFHSLSGLLGNCGSRLSSKMANLNFNRL